MPESAHGQDRPIRVVVPVYRGLQATKRCIDSVLQAGLPAGASVLVIDDCTPEEPVRALCKEAAENSAVDLLVNSENLGFVATANRAFEHCAGEDVVLLNSDTSVSETWLDRLQHCAYADASIGTVTPFSNNGTICSYPVFLEDNALPQGWSSQDLDSIASKSNRGMLADIPTAVGFCLYLKRACLDDVGMFDSQRFGAGYGEECDFSLRAAAKGWRNVLAGDVFVYHEGGVSFGQQSRERKLRAEEQIASMHPGYQSAVQAFIQDDPLAQLRRNIDLGRLASRPASSAQVLEEQDHARTSRINALTTDNTDLRRELSEALVSCEKLASELAQCRQRFEQTDQALSEAQQHSCAQQATITTLSTQLQAVSNQLHANREALEQTRAHCTALEAKIAMMERSRSWRYTAWMRRN